MMAGVGFVWLGAETSRFSRGESVLWRTDNLRAPVLRRHHVVVANDVVDFHGVDPMGKAESMSRRPRRNFSPWQLPSLEVFCSIQRAGVSSPRVTCSSAAQRLYIFSSSL
jgi:hypothetical protein